MESKQIMVHGAMMHYVTEGEGDNPILFLHGLSASTYMWKDIIAAVSPRRKCIAVDFIGMGESDKPKLNYNADDHLIFLKGFIEALNLPKVTLVMYGWSSIVGLAYAAQNEVHVSSLVMADPYLQLKRNYQDIPVVFQEFKSVLDKDPAKLHSLLVDGTTIIDKIIPNSRMNKLSPEAMEYYRNMYSTKESREVYLQSMLDHPYINMKSSAVPLIKQYSEWIQKTPMPKLMLYVVPGFVGTTQTLNWAKKNITHLTTVQLGAGISFFPELLPAEFSKALLAWL